MIEYIIETGGQEMNNQDKMTGKERQNLIIQTLKQEDKPITGSEFAKLTNVSRQVIVQDISILKAKNEPIIATSQGYIYLNADQKEMEKAVIVCKHTAEQTKEEMYMIVDHGVYIKDVLIEHQVYGEITASLHVSSRKEVDKFIRKIQQTNASLLSDLTGGIHLHTLEADSLDKIEAACKALKEAGILLSMED